LIKNLGLKNARHNEWNSSFTKNWLIVLHCFCEGDAMSLSGISTSSLSHFDHQYSQNQVSLEQFQQKFQQLGKGLQTGNVSAAQQDYTNIQQDAQTQAPHVHKHHHSHGDGETNLISQTFEQLGQALQSGSLSSAQQAYTTLPQEIQQLGSSQSSTGSTASSGISVTA
jgi:sulfite reductase alpha subunit-like flavoprotein